MNLEKIDKRTYSFGAGLFFKVTRWDGTPLYHRIWDYRDELGLPVRKAGYIEEEPTLCCAEWESCNTGIYYCDAIDIPYWWQCDSNIKDFALWIVKPMGDVIRVDKGYRTNKLKFVRKVTDKELNLLSERYGFFFKEKLLYLSGTRNRVGANSTVVSVNNGATLNEILAPSTILSFFGGFRCKRISTFEGRSSLSILGGNSCKLNADDDVSIFGCLGKYSNVETGSCRLIINNSTVRIKGGDAHIIGSMNKIYVNSNISAVVAGDNNLIVVGSSDLQLWIRGKDNMVVYHTDDCYPMAVGTKLSSKTYKTVGRIHRKGGVKVAILKDKLTQLQAPSEDFDLSLVQDIKAVLHSRIEDVNSVGKEKVEMFGYTVKDFVNATLQEGRANFKELAFEER